MSSERLFRFSGVALLVGGVLVALFTLIGTLLFPGNNAPTHALWVPVQMLIFVGSLLVLIGLPGMYVRQAMQAGWLGLIGFILTFLAALIIGVGSGIVLGIILPWLAMNAPKLAAGQGPPALNVLVIVTSLLFAVGAVLLGLATMRAGVLSRWAGLLLIMGGLVSAIGAAPFPPVLSNSVSNIGTVVFFLGIVWIGFTLRAAQGAKVTRQIPAL
jgi:hypothetical protein